MNREGLVVAIPVKDEEERLAACLAGLEAQTADRRPTVFLLVNNSTDASVAVARRFAARSRLDVLIEDVTLHARDASAGGARRIAMRRAATIAGAGGILLTTDADGVAAPDWLEVNLHAIAAGADAVAGRAIIDPVEEALIPQSLRDADALECAYADLLTEIDARIDPRAADPWPRHNENSGASLAVTVAAFHRVGGIPITASGEDRAFVRRLLRRDARLRHAPEARVVVSGRMEGRAVGGMADTIRRRMVCLDVFLDDALEPAQTAALRARLRRRARLAWTDPADADLGRLAESLRVAPSMLERALDRKAFGACWEALERASPRLARRRVPAAAVLREIAAARHLLGMLQPANGNAEAVVALSG